jgi:hypothetical protein
MAMVEHRMIPDLADRVPVINYGRKRSARLLVEERYDDARAIDLAIDILFVSIREEESALDNQSQTQALQQRLAHAECEYQEIVRGRDDLLESKQAQLREKVARLEQVQAEERQRFEAEWGDPRAKIPFSKPSPTLLQIRQKQKAYALVHDYDNAKAMKREAENLEREEAALGTARFEIAFRIAYDMLIEQQRKEMEVLKETSDTQYQMLSLEKEREIARKDRTKQMLKIRLDEPKPKKRPTIQVPIVRTRGEPPASGMITTRTRAELKLYRTAPENRRLYVRPDAPAILAKTSPRRTITVRPG